MVKSKGTELLEELKSVVSEKTVDALLPPLVFVLVNSVGGLETAAVSAVIFALLIGFLRLRRLGGPSVEEFKVEKEPPWQGQTRGF